MLLSLAIRQCKSEWLSVPIYHTWSCQPRQLDRLRARMLHKLQNLVTPCSYKDKTSGLNFRMSLELLRFCIAFISKYIYKTIIESLTHDQCSQLTRTLPPLDEGKSNLESAITNLCPFRNPFPCSGGSTCMLFHSRKSSWGRDVVFADLWGLIGKLTTLIHVPDFFFFAVWFHKYVFFHFIHLKSSSRISQNWEGLLPWCYSRTMEGKRRQQLWIWGSNERPKYPEKTPSHPGRTSKLHAVQLHGLQDIMHGFEIRWTSIQNAGNSQINKLKICSSSAAIILCKTWLQHTSTH